MAMLVNPCALVGCRPSQVVPGFPLQSSRCTTAYGAFPDWLPAPADSCMVVIPPFRLALSDRGFLVIRILFPLIGPSVGLGSLSSSGMLDHWSCMIILI